MIMVAPVIGLAAKEIGKRVAKKIAENPQKALLGGTSAALGSGTALVDAVTPDEIPRDQGVRMIKKLLKKEETEAEPEKKRSGGKVSSASKRADGCAQRGKTKGRMI
jgi:hypothetical protein